MLLETYVVLCMTEPICLKEKNFSQKMKKRVKCSFEFIGKFSLCSLNFVYNENLHYLLCSCANPIFGKNLVPEIWAKMLSASQIAGFDE